MFTRTKRRSKPAATEAARKLEVTPTSVLSAHAATALDAYGQAGGPLATCDASARLFLVLSDAVETDGRSGIWTLHFLLPNRHGEAVATVSSQASARGGYVVTASYDVTRFPRPGTVEWELAQQPVMAEMFEDRWKARLARLGGLPVPFTDSPDAIEAMHATGAPLFSGGPVRLKGRTLPTGKPVWEAVISTGTYHVPFSPYRWAG